MIHQAVNGTDSNLLLCACGCLQSLLSLHGSSHLFTEALSLLATLLEHMNGSIEIQEASFSMMMDTAKAVCHSVITQLAQCTSTEQQQPFQECIQQLFSILLSYRNVSNSLVSRFSLQYTDELIQSVYQIPSSSIRSVAKDLLTRIQEVSHQSRTNYLAVCLDVFLNPSTTQRVSG